MRNARTFTVTRLTGLSVAAIAMTLSSCGEAEKSQRGLNPLADMANTPAHKSQTAIRLVQPAVVEAGSATAAGTVTVLQVPTILNPPAGTVARGEVLTPTDPTDYLGAMAIPNPLLASSAVLKLGRKQYENACLACHGVDGNSSHAPMAKSWSGIPSLTTLNLAAISDGQVFHIISHGKNNRMPALAGRLPVQERWAVVHYVRTLARAALTAKDRATLVADVQGATALTATAAAQIIADYNRDAALIKAGGGSEFQPHKRIDPEQVKPTWDDAPAQKGGH